MTQILSSRIPNVLTNKRFEPFGLSLANYTSADDAKGYTYTTQDGQFPPTPMLTAFNPFATHIKQHAKYVMEIGCGVGRNLPLIMTETDAHYIGVDPNAKMLEYFWDLHPHEYKSRVSLYSSFDDIPEHIKVDFVIVTFVFQHIGYRPSFTQMNVADITLEAMKHTSTNCVWFVLEHEREEQWQERWLIDCNIQPTIYFKPGGTPFGGGQLPYPEFESMTHRGNDTNIIIFRENKS